MSGTGQEKLPPLVTPSKSWGSTGITRNSTARGARDTPHGLMEREPGLRTSGKPPHCFAEVPGQDSILAIAASEDEERALPTSCAAHTIQGCLRPADFWKPQKTTSQSSAQPSQVSVLPAPWLGPLSPKASPERRAAGPAPSITPTPLTFIRSYLSSTSCNQEMNCRALKRSLTDLFSSP